MKNFPGISHFPVIRTVVILFIIVMSASCSMPRFTAVEAASPYVRTKTGKTTTAEVVEVQVSKKGTKEVICGFEAYPSRTVTAFSDGHAEFHNIGDSQFAKKVVAGKLNLFTNNLRPDGRPGSYKPLNYFVQTGKNEELSQMSYDVLRTMIPADASARNYLKRYNNLNKVSYVLGGLALGVTSVGMFQIFADKKGTPGLPQNPSGVAISATGIWMFITAAVINEENKSNLFRAVKDFNEH